MPCIFSALPYFSMRSHGYFPSWADLRVLGGINTPFPPSFPSWMRRILEWRLLGFPYGAKPYALRFWSGGLIFLAFSSGGVPYSLQFSSQRSFFLVFSRGGSHPMLTWCPCLLCMEEVMHLLVPGCHPHHLALDDCPMDLLLQHCLAPCHLAQVDPLPSCLDG